MSPSPHPLTVMFADISGSAALFERLGDREAVHAVERCLKRMKRSIEGHRGRIVQIVGDEVLACFQSADDACHAAIDMHQRIDGLPPVSGLKLTIRVGLHHGPVSEEERTLSGPPVVSTARITGIARRDQILCSAAVVEALSESSVIAAIPMTELGRIQEEGVDLALYQIQWQNYQAGMHSAFSAFSGFPSNPAPTDRLALKFGGKTYFVDDNVPQLTIGRDLTCGLVVFDRKASRQHARIEKRNDGFYLIDTSTNGSFIAIGGQQEVLLRRDALLLKKSGQMCFGCSCNDAQAQPVDYDHR